MPVDVHLPIGVRMPRRLSPEDLVELEVRSGEAVRRAIEVARDEVLAPRGRSRPVVVSRSEVRFVDQLDSDIRGAVELAMSRAVEYAIEQSEIRAWCEDNQTPVGERVVREGFDPSRARDSVYRIPSYNGGGSPTAVVTMGDPEIEREIGIPTNLDEALAKAWQYHVRRFGPVWDPATFGYPGYYGTFEVDGRLMEDLLVYYASVGSIDENGLPLDAFVRGDSFSMISVPAEQRREGGESAEESSEDETRMPTFGRAPLPQSMDHYVLTRLEEVPDVDTLVRLQDEAAAADPNYPQPPDVRRSMAEHAADPNAVLYKCEGGPHVFYMIIRPAVGDEGIDHSPIRFVVDTQMQLGGGEEAGEQGSRSGGGGDGEGGGLSTGSDGAGSGGGGHGRRRGGLLGNTEGEGSVWPTLGLGGDALVCEPFLGEPGVHELLVGGEMLEGSMRALAATIELDYCGFAGKFCINLAKLIGARAHAIGVTSTNSSTVTRVTVRGDGGGNNGFVDIQPGDAPEFEYLQLLGDLAVQVNDLANDVARVYRADPNRHLIYRDEERSLSPDPEAWALRFFGEITDALDASCMWLFAECCRVILLQQLRSSNMGITQRQARFEETAQRFEEALGILGESVVKISVLSRTLEYANTYRLSGSVRDVLSFQPPERHIGDDETYQPPAPIHSIAPQILDLLVDARIDERSDGRVAVYRERDWTAEDMQRAIALRRGLLNQADPLFLQVPDLDALYMRFRQTPRSASDYLAGLLDEMLRANTEMTREASFREDGAFFALEASQYIKAEGGYNSRGLEYDLQGIHQLADDILAPYARGTDAYRRGINKAIGIKAGWDDFVLLFATAGIIALGLLCAPLGAAAVMIVTGVAGLALTLYDISEADRLEQLYRGLEDPEAIVSWQDVELQRLMANLSIAFSIFDLVQVGRGARIAASAARGLREATEGGARGLTRAATQAMRRQVLGNMTEEVLEQAVRRAMSEAAVVVAMQALLPYVITPVLVPWIRGVAAAHGTLPEVDATLGALADGQPASPDPIDVDVVSLDLDGTTSDDGESRLDVEANGDDEYEIGVDAGDDGGVR